MKGGGEGGEVKGRGEGEEVKGGGRGGGEGGEGVLTKRKYFMHASFILNNEWKMFYLACS